MTLHRFPAVAGYRLAEKERHLAEFYLSSYPVVRRNALELAVPGTALSFYPSLNIREIGELVDWCLPVLVLSGVEPDKEERNNFLSAGIAAVFPMLSSPGLHFAPELELPADSGSVFVITDDPALRKLYRQILCFAGYDVRMDFHSSEEVMEILSGSKDWPHFILADLDCRTVDPLSFFTRLKSFLKTRSALRGRTRMLVTKDLSRPGLDPLMASQLRPYARRIFHPQEALLALVECCLLFTPGAKSIIKPDLPAYRSLEEVLFGNVVDMNWQDPRRFFSSQDDLIRTARRALPFLWLPEHLKDESIRRGAILTSEAVD